jgi:putative transposase
MPELFRLLLHALIAGFRSRRELALENLVLRHSLQVALRTNPSPRLGHRDRILWVWLYRPGRPAARTSSLSALKLRSVGTGRAGGSTGPGSLAPDVVDLASAPRSGDLIAQISRDSRLWGTERIRGELLKLGIVVSNPSIRRYRWRMPRPQGSQGWHTFLRDHLNGIWAADLFVVHTVGFRTLYVLFFIGHDRRELIHFNVTSSPTAGGSGSS